MRTCFPPPIGTVAADGFVPVSTANRAAWTETAGDPCEGVPGVPGLQTSAGPGFVLVRSHAHPIAGTVTWSPSFNEYRAVWAACVLGAKTKYAAPMETSEDTTIDSIHLERSIRFPFRS